MTEPIAKIKLAPGNVGYYDSLTNIVLTKAQPEAIIYSGKNTINIKKAIKEGKVLLQEGSLSSYKNIVSKETRDNKNNIPKKNNDNNKDNNKVKEKQKDIYKIISEKSEKIDSNSSVKKNEDKKPVTNNKTKKEEVVETAIVEVPKEKDTKTTNANSTKKD